MEKDTIGSKIRNKLTPFFTALELLDNVNKSEVLDIKCPLDRDTLFNFMLRNRDSLWDSFHSLEEISKIEIVDQTIIED